MKANIYSKIKEYLFRKEQIIILQNRRGFSTVIQCKDCGYIQQCHHCSIALTYHKRSGELLCHYCGFTKAVQISCENCHGRELTYSGAGTQRVEEELQNISSDISILRMDADTTTGKGSHDRIASQFEQGEKQVLLGTQMIAKGFDFPNVNFVGVISADTSLFLPDFRASERTFQLLTQVAGRAGRRKIRGEVLIQTYVPKNLTIQCALKQDFQQFYDMESAIRSEFGYPPFGKLITIVFRGPSEQEVVNVANKFASILSGMPHPGKMYGPTPCAFSKLQDNFRWQILLKAPRGGSKSLRTWAKEAARIFSQKCGRTKVIFSIDVDPMSIL